MQRPLPVILLIAATAIAGCFGGGDDDAGGFSVKAPKDEGGMYRFTATVSADEYKWDFGDRLTTATGKTVEHAYDFTDGTVTVRLTAVRDGEPTQYTKEVVLGSGTNSKPSLVLEAETNWTIPGQPVVFSGAASTDPEGDTMRFSWNCIRDRDAVFEATPHGHGGAGGVPFQTPGSGSGASRVATGPLPTPEEDFGSDICGGMQESKASTAGTVAGAFAESGVYQVSLIGSDGPNPTISTQFTIYVTDPSDRPAPAQTFVFPGTLRGGTDGTVQGPIGQVGGAIGDNTTYDMAVHRFQLPLNAANITVSVTHDGGPSTVGLIVFQTKRSGTALHDQQSDPWSATGIQRGSYEVDVVLQQGVEVQYTLTVEADLKMDPTLYFA